MSHPPALHVGACSLAPHKWQSVDRTRRFYRAAIEALGARISDLDRLDHAWPAIDVLLNFTGNVGWQAAAGAERDFPAVFCLHGGAVLDRAFLLKSLPSLRTGDALIVNCRSDVAVLSAMLGPDRPAIEVLPLPVDTTLFNPQGRAAARAELGLAPDCFCIGIVARLLPQKNVHGALRVAAELMRRHPDRAIRIVLVGDFWIDYPTLKFGTEPYSGQLRDTLRQLDLEDKLTYLPAKLSDQELATVYRSFDVLLHPTNSIDENFGYAPIEAMASGVPVVGNAYGGLKDTVEHGVSGFLAPCWLSLGGIREDAEALLAGLQALLTDPALAATMAGQARARAETHYAPAVCSTRLQAILTDTVARWHSQARRPLATRPPRDMAAYDACLTPLNDRLSDYAESIDHYVSQPPPAAAGLARLQGYAGWTDAADGAIRLDNPAWPAHYRLTASQLALLRHCADGAAIAPWLRSAADTAELDHLLQLGLLVPAYPSTELAPCP